MRLPLARVVTVPRSLTSTCSTCSPNLNDTARSRRWNRSDSTISSSQKSSMRRTLVDDRDPHAERGEHRGVLDADDPGAHDHHGRRDVSSLRMPSESTTLMSSNSTCVGRAGQVPGASTILPRRTVTWLPPSTATVCGSMKCAVPVSTVDVVAQQLAADHLDLAADHVLRTRCQVGDRDVVLDPVAGAVELALGMPGEVEDRLAQRLGRDRAGVDADAADHVATIDDADAAPELRGGYRRPLAARTAADDQQVVVVPGIAHDRSLTQIAGVGKPYAGFRGRRAAPAAPLRCVMRLEGQGPQNA